MFGRAVAGTSNCLEQTRFRSTPIATCTIGSHTLVGCFFNCMRGTRKTTPISSDADAAPPGHGVLLWFQIDDFDLVVERVRGLGAEILEEPHVNPAPRHREIWLRDPDGYVVVVASPDGECGS